MTRNAQQRYAVYTLSRNGEIAYQHAAEKAMSWPTYDAAAAAIPGIVEAWNATAAAWGVPTIAASQLGVGVL
jgi:hypothetical protein